MLKINHLRRQPIFALIHILTQCFLSLLLLSAASNSLLPYSHIIMFSPINITLLLVTLLLYFPTSKAFTLFPPKSITLQKLQTVKLTTFLKSSKPNQQNDDDLLNNTHSPPPAFVLTPQTKKNINHLIETNPILLFMKGTPLQPQCGFSQMSLQILPLKCVRSHRCNRAWSWYDERAWPICRVGRCSLRSTGEGRLSILWSLL